MCGYQVPRKAGWDCHGLPVELEVERQLGISSKHEIEEYGIAEFNQRCRESVFSYVEEWNRLTERIGFWIDLDDAYVTLAHEYIESVWWALRQIWDHDLLYEGHKVVPYCPRCGTALSSHEVALGYHDVVDPSIYVRFPVREPAGPLQEGDSLLIWTTTPWTLVVNAAVAVDPELTYVRAQLARRWSSWPRARVERGAGRGARRCSSASPDARSSAPRYEPPFPFIPGDEFGERGHTVLPGDFVSAEDGTGLVHAAVAFGEDDFRLGEQHGLAVVNPVRPDGTYDERIGPYAGRGVEGRRPRPDRGPAQRAACSCAPRSYEHAYPHCWRCDTPLLYYAKASWYIRTTAVRDELLRANEEIELVPVPHQARALRQVAREQRRLGAVARALLGHAAARLALRAGPRRTASARSRSCSELAGDACPRTCTGPYIDEVTFAVPGLRERDEPRAGGDRRLVRLGRDAVRAVPLPVRERGGVQAALPGRLHLRGARPDARLVLLAARDLDAPVRPARATRTCSASG